LKKVIFRHKENRKGVEKMGVTGGGGGGGGGGSLPKET